MLCCLFRRKRPPASSDPAHIPHGIAGGSRFFPAIPAGEMTGRSRRRSRVLDALPVRELAGIEEQEERAVIEAGVIQAMGVRDVGEQRALVHRS
jgi:hypothetical protein